VRLADLLKRKASLRERYERARAKEVQADEAAARDALLADVDEAAVKAGIKADIRAWMYRARLLRHLSEAYAARAAGES
jgi:ethanolamine ammonia-lyase small subunit